MSSIIDTIPELVEVGPGSFFADGIYLGGPRVHRGTVTLAPVRMGKEIFLGLTFLAAVSVYPVLVLGFGGLKISELRTFLRRGK